jgi:hypothetical protein
MANRDLLKEAIADAKAVKETAIANAKAALEESFTPYLREKLAAKLQEMDDEDSKETNEMKKKELEENYDSVDEMDSDKMYEEESVEEELDLEELLRELDELEEGDDSVDERLGTINDPTGDYEHGNLAEAEEGEEEVEGEGEEEEIDLENMDEDDLKKFIEDVIADMVASGELEGNMEGEEEMEMEITERKKLKSSKMVKENQSSSPKLLDFVDGDNTQALKTYKMLGFNVMIDDEANNEYAAELDFKGYDWLAVLAMLEDCERMGVKPFMTWNGENYEFEEAMKLADEKAAVDDMDDEGRGTRLEAKHMKKELDEAYAALRTIKNELNEVNLLNAKLLYTNKIFKAQNLTERQKTKVLEAFDQATSVKETKLVYETLITNIKPSSVIKNNINESLIKGVTSKPMVKPSKQPIVETDNQVARWQKLAGIIK